MAKFVCDTDQVFAQGEKISKVASSIGDTVSTYATNSEKSLSEWSGYAQKCFHNVNERQIQAVTTNAKYIAAVGEYIQESAKAIQSLEEELASLDI